MKSGMKPDESVKAILYKRIEAENLGTVENNYTVVKRPWLPMIAAACVLALSVAVIYPLVARDGEFNPFSGGNDGHGVNRSLAGNIEAADIAAKTVFNVLSVSITEADARNTLNKHFSYDYLGKSVVLTEEMLRYTGGENSFGVSDFIPVIPDHLNALPEGTTTAWFDNRGAVVAVKVVISGKDSPEWDYNQGWVGNIAARTADNLYGTYPEFDAARTMEPWNNERLPPVEIDDNARATFMDGAAIYYNINDFNFWGFDGDTPTAVRDRLREDYAKEEVIKIADAVIRHIDMLSINGNGYYSIHTVSISGNTSSSNEDYFNFTVKADSSDESGHHTINITLTATRPYDVDRYVIEVTGQTSQQGQLIDIPLPASIDTMQWYAVYEFDETFTGDGIYLNEQTDSEYFAKFIDFYQSLDFNDTMEPFTVDNTIASEEFIRLYINGSTFLAASASTCGTLFWVDLMNGGTIRITKAQYEWFGEWARPICSIKNSAINSPGVGQ